MHTNWLLHIQYITHSSMFTITLLPLFINIVYDIFTYTFVQTCKQLKLYALVDILVSHHFSNQCH